jgi:hypothetical protein
MSEYGLDNILKLNKDLKNSATQITDNQARYLVDMYYQVQEHRIAVSAQIRALTEGNEPCEVMSWLFENVSVLEKEIVKALKYYTKGHPVGEWLNSIIGIGPVISAGLLAHIDITKAPTAGHIWSFAGLNPNAVWEKGKLRPHNAKLKTLCWKIGQSFVKVSNNPNDVYGKIYKARKEYELQKNENMEYEGQAITKLEKCKIGKTTEAYKAYSVGKLPLGHIQQRAERYAVKMFLSHLQDVWYRIHYKEAPPKPFAISILGHAHMIEAPNLDMIV